MGQDKFEDLSEDTHARDALMKEVQVDYDKYLRLYQQDKHTILGTKSKKPSRESKAYKAMELQSLQNRWSDYLHDFDEFHDLKPLMGLDIDFPQPERLGYKYDLSSVALQHKVQMNHVYENEYRRAREGRTEVKHFLQGQQEWLSKLRKEITYVGTGYQAEQPR